jgi:hypothetical protein
MMSIELITAFSGVSSERSSVISRIDKVHDRLAPAVLTVTRQRVEHWLKKHYEMRPDGLNDDELQETAEQVSAVCARVCWLTAYTVRCVRTLTLYWGETRLDVSSDLTVRCSESKASLKRSLVFVGGILRGYLRR